MRRGETSNGMLLLSISILGTIRKDKIRDTTGDGRMVVTGTK